MEANTDNAIRTLIEQDRVTVSRGTHNDWVLVVEPEATTGGPAMDPVEVWADHSGRDFRVQKLRHDDPAKDAYTADRSAIRYTRGKHK